MNSSPQKLKFVGACFGVPEAPCLTVVPIKSAEFSVTKVTRTVAERQVAAVRLPACEAYFLMLYLEDALHCDVLSDGSRTPVRAYSRGSACLVDLRHGAEIELHSSLHSLAIALPRAIFDEVAEMEPRGLPQRLRCRRGEPDPVLSNLGMALLAFLQNGAVSPPAVLRHMATAVCAHLLHGDRETAPGGAFAHDAPPVMQ